MMNHEETHSTHQLAGIVLQVRDDIDILVREYGGQPTYLIEDELTSNYYRIGAAEYTFLSMLDGRNTFATALGRTAALMHRDALTEDRAATFCTWLVQNGLASTEQSRTVERLEEHSEQGQKTRNRGRWGLMSQRFPLLHPRESVDLLTRMFGWCFGPPMILLWVLLVAIGISTIALHWDRFRQSTDTIIARDNWMWLIGVWLGLKVVHELAHGIACRKFGGAVREVGAMFIVFVPLPYVDVSSAWRFASKWHRIVTSSAGMMAELAIAAIAAIVWSRSGPGLMSQNALNIVMSAGITTLLFNANPLMRFDGYFILTDLLELPNLYTHGHSALLQLGRRWGLGLKAKQQDYPEGRKRAILVYGIATFCWKIMISVGIVLAADMLFYGLGTLLAVAAVGAWLLLPLVRLLKFVAIGSKLEQPSRVRFVFLVATLMLVVLLLEWAVPWYSSATAPLVVDYYPQTEIRTPVSGFVEVVDVAPGQRVHRGDRLFLLRNEELTARLKELEIDIRLANSRRNVYLDRKEIPSAEVEAENIETLEERYNDLREQAHALTVTAPVSGVVLDHDLNDLQGAYVSTGRLLVRLGGAAEIEALALVPQFQEEFFRAHIQQRVVFHVDGTGTAWHDSELLDVAPRATREIPHVALAAHTGGSLAVRINNDDDDPSHATARYELVDPHFLARVRLSQSGESGDHATIFAPGQTGTLACLTEDGSVGQHLRRTVIDWWNVRQRAARDQLYRH